MTDSVRSHTFRSMGTHVAVLTGARCTESMFRSAIRRVTSVFEREDQRFSRFRKDSELSRVNASAGRWTHVSPPFLEVLERSLHAARQTLGLFDPTVLPALVAAGYDRDFEEVRIAPLPPRPPGPAARWGEVEVRGDEVRLPPNAGLDFGGIAKGWTVDLAVEGAADLAWIVVNAGGDLRAGGELPSGLSVRVEDPLLPREEATRLALCGGSLATSSITARHWGPSLHHLIDPRTGRPAVTDVVQATAWAESCAEAEVRSKWALLGGPSVLDEVPALLVMHDGNIVTSLAPLGSEGVPA